MQSDIVGNSAKIIWGCSFEFIGGPAAPTVTTPSTPANPAEVSAPSKAVATGDATNILLLSLLSIGSLAVIYEIVRRKRIELEDGI